MNSRVHPKDKTKYRVTNWAENDQSLVQRGDITLWITPEAIRADKRSKLAFPRAVGVVRGGVTGREGRDRFRGRGRTRRTEKAMQKIVRAAAADSSVDEAESLVLVTGI